jgi:hypothetical protein
MNVCRLRVVTAGISPLIWRRLEVPAGTTVAGLHTIVQTVFGWSGEHLHPFVIGGTEYGISYPGGPGFRHDVRQVRLSRSHVITLVIRRKTNRRYMISDHHGRVTDIATSLLTATDGILGTHKFEHALMSERTIDGLAAARATLAARNQSSLRARPASPGRCMKKPAQTAGASAPSPRSPPSSASPVRPSTASSPSCPPPVTACERPLPRNEN